MDIYCPKCGEPWDHDTLHDIAGDRYPEPYWLDLNKTRKNPDYDSNAYQFIYKKVVQDFQTRGCEAVDSSHNTPSTDTDRTFGLTRQDAAAALYDVLGDDLNGAAAMLEDMGY